jgi:uncharacterized protein (TIGR02246 family)
MSFTTSAIASDEDDVLQVMENWCKASNTSDFKLFSSVYLNSPETSQFHPTAGVPFLYKGWDAIENNWKSTFTEPTGSVEISIHNPDVTMMGDDAAVVAYYELVTSTSDTGEETIEQHRITRVLQKIDGRWLIVHDHASNLP